MPFALPSFAEARQLLVAAFSGRFPEVALSRHHHAHKLASIFALGLADLHYHLRQVGRDLNPETADDTPGQSMLRRIGRVWGVEPRGASGAHGTAALRVYGEEAAAVPSDELLRHLQSGLRFETRSAGVIPAAGFLDVDIAGVDGGLATNLELDQELAFDVTPPGLETTARIVVALAEGEDEEGTDSYRGRVLNRIGLPAMGGNRNDYEQWVLEAATFVDFAFVYPNRAGLGTVDVAALKRGSGSSRLLSAGERDQVLAYVDPLRPVSATIRVLEVVAAPTDVDARVLPESDPAYAFDWHDETPPEVATYDDVTRLLTFGADRPASMAAGDRLIFDSDDSDGRQYVIEALSGTDAVVLAAELAFAPVALDLVYSGGPVVDPARDAILALFDRLGPANPDANRYGPWEGNLRRSTLFEVVQTSEGVLDSDPLVPAANVEAEDFAFPDDLRVELLVPGKVIVRRWWQ